jgi:hypothetical protein
MYQLNPLMRNVLITTDEVIFHAPSKQTLDPRTILNSIIIAEETIIIPALGYTLYADICAAKNKLVTNSNKSTLQDLFTNGNIINVGDIVNAFEFLSADYQSLWKEVLWKLTAEAVMLVAYPEAFIQFGSEGIVHTSPTSGPMISAGAVTPGLNSVKWAMDKKMLLRIDPMIQSVHSFICRNQSKYPKYGQECLECGEEKQSRKTDFVLGLYDDEDSEPNRCRW